MQALIVIIKAVLMWGAKRYATELIVDAGIEAAEKLAESTTFTNVDDEVAAKLKKDRNELIKVIRNALQG